MSKDIVQELLFFLHAAITGMALLVAYDALRILRRVIKHGSFIIAIEDFVYWFFSSLLIFYILLKENDGIIRWFFVAGILLGMVIYNISISQYVVRFLSFTIIKILVLVGKFLKIIATPLRFVCKLLEKMAKRIIRIFKKVIKTIKKRLKKSIRAFRIGISRK